MPESASSELFAVAENLLPGLEGKAVGGGSDGNFTAAPGVSTLDGLGAVGGGTHADHEYLVTGARAQRADYRRTGEREAEQPGERERPEHV